MHCQVPGLLEEASALGETTWVSSVLGCPGKGRGMIDRIRDKHGGTVTSGYDLQATHLLIRKMYFLSFNSYSFNFFM